MLGALGSKSRLVDAKPLLLSTTRTFGSSTSTLSPRPRPPWVGAHKKCRRLTKPKADASPQPQSNSSGKSEQDKDHDPEKDGNRALAQDFKESEGDEKDRPVINKPTEDCNSQRDAEIAGNSKDQLCIVSDLRMGRGQGLSFDAVRKALIQAAKSLKSIETPTDTEKDNLEAVRFLLSSDGPFSARNIRKVPKTPLPSPSLSSNPNEQTRPASDSLALPAWFQNNITEPLELVTSFIHWIAVGDVGDEAPFLPDSRDAMQTKVGEVFEFMSQHKARGSISPEDDYYVGISSGTDVMALWTTYNSILCLFHTCISSYKYLGREASRKRWESDLKSLQSILADKNEAIFLVQLLRLETADKLCQCLDDILSGKIARDSIAPIPPPGINPKLYAHVEETIRAHLELRPAKLLSGSFSRPHVILDVSLQGPTPNIYKANPIAQEMMHYIASSAGAVLISLDPRDLAEILANYANQNEAWKSGNFSKLAYSSALATNRLARRKHFVPDGEQLPEPALLRHIEREMAANLGRETEDATRWDVVKAKAAMEDVLDAVDPSRDLVIHIDEFAEFSSTQGGKAALKQLQSIMNRHWLGGRRICLVGTTSHSASNYTRVSEELRTLHDTNTFIKVPIDIKAWEDTRGISLEWLQKQLYLQHNIENLTQILQGMNDHDVQVSIKPDISSPRWKRLFSVPNTIMIAILPKPTMHHLASLVNYFASREQKMRNLPILEIKERHFAKALESFEDADVFRQSYRKEDSVIPMTSLLDASVLEGTNINQQSKRMLSLTGLSQQEEQMASSIVSPDNIDSTWDDVHVSSDTIDSLKTITSLSLERPDAFSYGILATDKISGCLLYGPPGTGKTLLARAVAKDNRASVIEVSGASLNDMWFGNSEKNVQALFKLARKMEPCVIFVDEADALLGARSGRTASGQAPRVEVLNQFLREWDGIRGSRAFVMVATNRPFDLDEAALRRMPRRILVDLPLDKDREAILRILLKNEKLAEDVDLDDIARRTPYYSGSDLKHVCVTAAMMAVKEELAEAKKHQGPEPYAYPEKRLLQKRHFEAALKDISSSISEDMETLTAIRKFDQKYGSGRKTTKKARSMGFSVVPPKKDSEDALVRKGEPVPA